MKRWIIVLVSLLATACAVPSTPEGPLTVVPCPAPSIAGGSSTVVRRGELVYVVAASWYPSLDGHRESTYAMTHPIRPFYSLLIKVNPENPTDPTDFVGDVAKSWAVSKGGTVYTFKIRKGIRFHDGCLLTARDVKATYEKIIWPPQGVVSIRITMYNEIVKTIESHDDYTIVFRLKFP